MTTITDLLNKNKAWVNRKLEADADYFKKLANLQTPKFLWIGCADSRIPATQVVDLQPGECFVHRNIANLVVHTDINCLSVLQYAVEYLKVEEIIVCGHYGCGGIEAAFSNIEHGIVDNWLRHIKDIVANHDDVLSQCATRKDTLNKLAELNVHQQVQNVAKTDILQNAWRKQQPVRINGWIYELADGILTDLDCSISSAEELESIYRLD